MSRGWNPDTAGPVKGLWEWKTLASATDHKNLRTGTPVWLGGACPRMSTADIRDLPRSSDVVVIGSGITFSMMAAQLIQRQLSGIDDPDRDLFAFPLS